MAETTPICDFGWTAPDFRLPATDGRTYTLDELKGPNGTLVMFICNHCPYVQAILDRLVRDTKDLAALGIASVAISSNDATAYPEDSFPRMREAAEAHRFPFPYLYDESQQVARRYGAVCTPDFFGFNRDLALQYRGRLDESGRNPGPAGARRELLEAMTAVAATGRGPEHQVPSMGCSIKWKDA
jgi:peroxiredoxin